MRFSDLRTHIARLSRESWILFVAITTANASNYVFHVVVSRTMPLADYGALNAVLAILIWLSVPLGAIQTTVAKRLAESGNGEQPWRGMLRAILPVGIAVSLIAAAAAPLLESFLRLDSIWTALFVAVYILPALLLTVCRGVLQGRLHFHQLAVVSVIPIAVRLGVGIPIVQAGGGVPGAVAATVIADICGVLLALWLLGRDGELGFRSVRRDTRFLREVFPIILGLAGMWLLIELDVILARRFLVPEEAGTYSAAGLLARAVLFVPGAVSLVALPHFSHQRGRGAEAYKWLMSSTALVAGLGLLTACALSVAGDFIVAVTFGDRYAGAAEFLPWLSAAMVGMGVANLLVFFHIAAGSRMFHLLWPIAAVEALAIAVSHSGGNSLAVIVTAVAWVAAAFAFYAARSVALSPTLLSRLPEDTLIRSAHIDRRESPELSVVVPSFNGGAALERVISAMAGVLGELDRSYEIIVVSDGSTDGSIRSLAGIDVPLSIIHYGRRHGKGVALRIGMTRARGRYIAFADGDGDLDPSELKSFLVLMDMYDPDMVIGSKRHPLSVVDYPLTRRMLSWCYQRVVRVLFGLNVRDTQTGMKLIRRDVLDAVLPKMLEKRFAFDLEFLVVAKRLGHNRFFEAPVKLDYKFASSVSPRAVFRILIDTAAIFYRLHILRFYDYPVLARPTESAAYAAQLAGLAEHAAGP